MMFYVHWNEKKKLFNELSADQVLECINSCTVSEEADTYRLSALKNRKELRVFDLNNIRQLTKESEKDFQIDNLYQNDLNNIDVILYKK